MGGSLLLAAACIHLNRHPPLPSDSLLTGMEVFSPSSLANVLSQTKIDRLWVGGGGGLNQRSGKFRRRRQARFHTPAGNWEIQLAESIPRSSEET